MAEKTSYKGFLHQTEGGAWILCDAPRLKSCCLKKHTLVNLEGDFSGYPQYKPVVIKGTYNPATHTFSGEAVNMQGSFSPLWAIFLGTAIVMFIIRKIRRV